MNLLLDTHIALWAIADDPKLPEPARALIEDPATEVWVSVVSLWEIAIKFALGRGDMPVSATQAKRYFEQAGYRLLNVEASHVLAVERLPAHHADPFDRLLFAQAISEPQRLLTHDAILARYGELVMLV